MSDLISRQDAIDAVHYYIESGYKCDIFQELKDLPSAETERTVKIHDDKIHPVIHHCGKDIVTLINPTWNYCPYCGKKLEWI